MPVLLQLFRLGRVFSCWVYYVPAVHQIWLELSGPLVVVILAGGALVVLGIWLLFQSLSNALHSESNPNIAKISVSRLVGCGTGCHDLNNTQIISNYPKLKEALNQTDAKYIQKVNDNNCHNNACIRELFLNDIVDFTMPVDRALRMTDDLLLHGAVKRSLCLEGGCHELEFRVNRDATYLAVVDYRYEVFAGSRT